MGVVQFDTTKKRFVAAVDDFSIKFSNVDHPTNDVQEPNHEKAVSCFALSKNACYVISTSGGKISLFNMMTFKRVTRCPLL
ncbi:hypothetical protein EJD97_019833 [Solanum chilense]|uniref:Uncharacterized protein n=1 Tax=Solanum chilense TaxID=4083 RepID=A0A6N2B0N1_SOLCI|nr:hypothetical protein EJD97_019833 [Solanum chilense]